MPRRFFTFFLLLISVFSFLQTTNAQTSGGCQPPLELKMTAGGAMCQMVYTSVSELPPGCTNPSMSDVARLAYANDVRSVECQPQAGYSIALPGQYDPATGKFHCPTYQNGDNVNVNVGWVMVYDGSFVWHGGCGDFSSSWSGPLPQPTGGPGTRPNSVDRCDSTEALASGATVWTGTDSAGNLQPLPYKLSGRDACISYAGMISCGVSNNSVFDPNFNFGNCCQYGVNPNIKPGETIYGCGGAPAGGGLPVGNGGVATPWGGSGTNGGVNPGGGGFLTDVRNTLNNAACLTSASCITQTLASGNAAAGAAGGNQNVARPPVQSGNITVSVPTLNIRSLPSTLGTLLGNLKLNQTFVATGWVNGMSVEGINTWWKGATEQYIWSGGTVQQPTGTPLPAPSGSAGSAGGNTNSSQLLFTTSNGNTTSVKVGDTWTIAIVGVNPNTPVYAVGGKSGAQDVTQMGTTDANGNFTISGTYRLADLGNWNETWRVGTTTIGSLGFSVFSGVGFAPGKIVQVKVNTVTDTRGYVAVPGMSGKIMYAGTSIDGKNGWFIDFWEGGDGVVPEANLEVIDPPSVDKPGSNNATSAYRSTTFRSGQRVQSNVNVNVRAVAYGSGDNILGVQNTGSFGTVVGGGISSGEPGWDWWFVNWDNGVDGWSLERYLTPTSPTSANLPSPTPVSMSTKFSVGQRIQTTTVVNVRSAGSLSSGLLGFQANGAMGTVVSGGLSSDGYYWWEINYDNGFDGWSAETYLGAYSGTNSGTTSGTTGTGTGTGTITPNLIFITSGGNNKNVKVGENWVIGITGATKNSLVSVVGGKSGAQDVTPMGTTDADGKFSISGTFKAADAGSWQQTWKVGGVTVGTFSFTLSAVGSVGAVVDTSAGNNPPSPPPPPVFAATNNNIGVYAWGGNLTDKGGNGLLTEAGLIRKMGVNKIRLALSSRTDKDYDIGGCINNFSLTSLAQRSDISSVLAGSEFKTVMLTAFDGTSFPDCATENFLNLDFMSSSANVEKIKNEYKDLANYLKGFTGKTFIISNWEGDNAVYCYSSYYNSGNCPGTTAKMDAYKKWVGAYIDGIRLAGAGNVFSAVEFNSVNDLKNKGLPSVLYNVVPSVNPDYVSYSSYESANKIITGDNGVALKADIATALTASGKSTSRFIVGEYGYGADASGTKTDFKNRLQIATNAIEAAGISNYFVWAGLDSVLAPSFGMFEPSGVMSESGKYVCGIAGGTNCN